LQLLIREFGEACAAAIYKSRRGSGGQSLEPICPITCELCAPNQLADILLRGYGIEFRDLYLRQTLLTVNSIGKHEASGPTR
jgi:hypothetical protein